MLFALVIRKRRCDVLLKTGGMQNKSDEKQDLLNARPIEKLSLSTANDDRYPTKAATLQPLIILSNRKLSRNLCHLLLVNAG
ncbi:protein of unknown function [Xenorhabdus poinarii G6]|uniref:Uncharacterized protein n=1 Tax=Xenorhabdus poinarii G6 TaxID=1354304 RepID=A0A068R7L7_9GAMM|nr:protein of unknown function [Xenorhabdus poinarii G6]